MAFDKLTAAQAKLREIDIAMQEAKEAEKQASNKVKSLLLKQQLEIQKGPPSGMSGLGFWPLLIALGQQITSAVIAQQEAKKRQKQLEQQRKQAEAEAKAAEAEARKKDEAQAKAAGKKQGIMGIPISTLMIGGAGIAGVIILTLILRNK